MASVHYPPAVLKGLFAAVAGLSLCATTVAAALAVGNARGASGSTVKCPRTTNSYPKHLYSSNTYLWVITHADGHVVIIATDPRDESGSYGTVLASVRATSRVVNPICLRSAARKTKMSEPIGPYPVLTESRFGCLGVRKYQPLHPTLTFLGIRNRAHRQIGTRILVSQGSERLLQVSLLLSRGGGVSFAYEGCYRNPPTRYRP
jgi:hypothetical protein